jgi:hypothetical protein
MFYVDAANPSPWSLHPGGIDMLISLASIEGRNNGSNWLDRMNVTPLYQLKPVRVRRLRGILYPQATLRPIAKTHKYLRDSDIPLSSAAYMPEFLAFCKLS